MVSDKVINYGHLGKRIKVARAVKGWSQVELADRADLSVTFLSNIENAHSKASLATFVKIANALEIGVDGLLCDSLKECNIQLNKQLASVIEDCSDYELRIIVGMVVSIKSTLRDVNEYMKRINP